jgi:hypothetical protein
LSEQVLDCGDRLTFHHGGQGAHSRLLFVGKNRHQCHPDVERPRDLVDEVLKELRARRARGGQREPTQRADLLLQWVGAGLDSHGASLGARCIRVRRLPARYTRDTRRRPVMSHGVPLDIGPTRGVPTLRPCADPNGEDATRPDTDPHPVVVALHSSGAGAGQWPPYRLLIDPAWHWVAPDLLGCGAQAQWPRGGRA